MATTWTQADIDRLESAISKGGALQSMTFGDQTYTFSSLEDRLRLLATMRQAVQAAANQPTGYRLAATSKGV